VSQLGAYTFLPWLRTGVANTLTKGDEDKSVHTRATTHVELQLAGDTLGGGKALPQTVSQDVFLYGPGDIVGIDERAIVRTEPRNWITNFESNHLAAIDFYDEDFPWRYTPAAPDAGRLKLRPWIALVVLTESEFSEGGNLAGRPLPYITVSDVKLLPPAQELWAWAHVHVNAPLTAPGEVVSADPNAVLSALESALAANRDAAYARLLCPRRLQANTAYHAFVIPTFEPGRLAGLGLSPDKAPYATASAWAQYNERPQGSEFPYYYRWYFRTGSYGDFAYLVRLLKAQPVDPRVGTREMDVSDPGSNLPGISRLGGVLRLGGALRVPEADLDESALEERRAFEEWDEPYPQPFQKALAAFVNLADGYSAQPPQAANKASEIEGPIEEDPDPLLTAPLYARWHALTQRLLTERDGSPAADDRNWVHNVNLDPRFRVAAGFGAGVVESNAEEYMADAWQQVGEVLAANSLIRRLHLAAAIASRWHDLHLTPLAAAQPERAFALSAPVHSKLMASPTTVAHVRSSSLVAPALTSAAMRRVLRPGGRLMRLSPFDASVTPANLLARVNAGEVSAAPPVSTPAGVLTVEQVAAAAEPGGTPSVLPGILARYPWLPWALIALGVVALVLLALVLGLAIGLPVGVALLAGLAALARWLWRLQAQSAPALAIEQAGQTPAAVGELPHNPAFTLSEPGSAHSTPTGSSDSPTAARFKQALGDSFALLDASAQAGARPALSSLDMRQLTATVLTGLDPTVTIPTRGFSTIKLPEWVSSQLLADYGEVMAYPKIDLPMYEPLKTEQLLPNIGLIPPNSITLVETNQRFIESYMIGLNYEFGRKLLWREYPTDLRGSYFRQFWDVRGVMNSESLSPSALKEKLYDIPPLNHWARVSALGQHNNRQSAGEHGEQAVLVIRGELLKKYPTAVIYAQRAEWELQGDGTPDLSKPRKLVKLSEAEEHNPPPSKLRPALYEAKADPDIYFFGFDLTIPEAKGGSGKPPDTDAGWFFVIKERPGEPRFGLELSGEGTPEVLEDVTWQEALGGGGEAGGGGGGETGGGGGGEAGGPGDQFLPAGSLAPVALSAPPKEDPEEKQSQHDEDEQADAAAVSAARWAYLLLRAPVMVAIHADQMLGSRS
jgi:hypothetical protein